MYITYRYGHRIIASSNSSSLITASIPSFQRRAVSQKSAINRGLRSGLFALRERQLDRAPARPWKDQNGASTGGGRGDTSNWTPNQAMEVVEDLGFSGKELKPTQTSPISRREQEGSLAPAPAVRIRRLDFEKTAGPTRAKFPVSVPYTTAASEFLYGHSTVYAALRAGRRKAYTLYVHSRGKARDDLLKTETSILKMARNAGIKVKEGHDQGFLQMLDKMSAGRAHNGIVLEASPLPIVPLHALNTSSQATSTFDILLGNQSAEQLAINGTPKFLSYNNPQPVLLLLDDILDPGNLGAILRTAYFLGIDAVIMTTHCAPMNPQALKSSSGAAEAIPLFRVAKAETFLERSVENGWHVLCGTTPNTDAMGRRNLPAPLENLSRRVRYWGATGSSQIILQSKLCSSPQMIVVGGEGRGLRPFLTQHAGMFLEILPARDPELLGIDSLNVSVATAMICQDVMFSMRAGEKAKKIKDSKREEEKRQQMREAKEGTTIMDGGEFAPSQESNDRFAILESELTQSFVEEHVQEPEVFTSYRMANQYAQQENQQKMNEDLSFSRKTHGDGSQTADGTTR